MRNWVWGLTLGIVLAVLAIQYGLDLKDENTALKVRVSALEKVADEDKAQEWLSEGVLKFEDKMISRAQLLDLIMAKSLEKK